MSSTSSQPPTPTPAPQVPEDRKFKCLEEIILDWKVWWNGGSGAWKEHLKGSYPEEYDILKSLYTDAEGLLSYTKSVRKELAKEKEKLPEAEAIFGQERAVWSEHVRRITLENEQLKKTISGNANTIEDLEDKPKAREVERRKYKAVLKDQGVNFAMTWQEISYGFDENARKKRRLTTNIPAKPRQQED